MPKPQTPVDAGADDGSLFGVLRSLRRTIAASRGVPPYVVFADRTLKEMVQRMPRTEEEMLQVTGVGEVKLRPVRASVSCRNPGLCSRPQRPRIGVVPASRDVRCASGDSET